MDDAGRTVTPFDALTYPNRLRGTVSALSLRMERLPLRPRPTMRDFRYDIDGLGVSAPPNVRTYRYVISSAVQRDDLPFRVALVRLWNAGFRGTLLNPLHIE